MLKGSFCWVLVLSYSQFTFTGYIRGTRHCFLYIVLFNINNNPMRQILLLFLFSHMSKLRHKQINLPDFAQLVSPALRLIPKCSSHFTVLPLKTVDVSDPQGHPQIFFLRTNTSYDFFLLSSAQIFWRQIAHFLFQVQCQLFTQIRCLRETFEKCICSLLSPARQLILKYIADYVIFT